MKKALLALAVCSLLVTAASAAEPVTKAGSKALLFSVQDIGLQAYHGSGGVGFKYYLADGLALRPVLLFNYRTETVTTPPDTMPLGYNVTYEDGKDKYLDFGLELGLEKSLVTQGPVSIFAGGVAGFSLGSHDYNYGWTRNYNNGDIHNYTVKTEYGGVTSFNVAGLLGFECFLGKSVSISGEYRLGFAKSSSDFGTTTETNTDIAGGVTTTVTDVSQANGTGESNIGFSTAGITLGIYF